MVAVEIRPPPTRTKIGALACYAALIIPPKKLIKSAKNRRNRCLPYYSLLFLFFYVCFFFPWKQQPYLTFTLTNSDFPFNYFLCLIIPTVRWNIDIHGIQNTRVYMGKRNIAEKNRVFNSTRYTWVNMEFNNYFTSVRMRWDGCSQQGAWRQVGYNNLIKYPRSASRIIILLKTPTKYRELVLTLFVRTTAKVSGISCMPG